MEELEIQAKLLHIIFHNEQNGYTVARFVTYDEEERVFTATGCMREIDKECVWKLFGVYKEHPRYGMQFQVSAYTRMQPTDRTNLIRFFSGPLFPGIGKQTAAALVEALGEDCIDKIREDGAVLFQVPGLSAKKMETIRKGVAQSKEEDASAFLSRYGISVRHLTKIEALYGDEAVEIIKENPYRLVEDIDGIGFKTADRLGKELHFEKDDPCRVRAALLAAVQSMCAAQGDTYVEKDALLQRMKKEFADIDLDEHIDELRKVRQLIVEEERIYHHAQYDSEKGIADFLCGFPYTQQEEIELAVLRGDLANVEEQFHIRYDESQKNAIASFFQNPFFILTGGPGTGKTTIVKGIIALYQKYFPTQVISCCAPTGRAAKRLGEMSGCSASTIHSLLKWDLETNTFLVNEQEPLQVDLLIIDEFSMVDQWLFYHLLRAGKRIGRLLVIGDEEQLPSVGCGCVLKDLIASHCFPCVRLKRIFRQQEGSDVISLAHAVSEEKLPALEDRKDVAFFPCESYEVKDLLVSIVSNALKKGYDPVRDIQVLAPMYGGAAGIDALNHVLQKLMNPPSPYKEELQVAYRLFRVGDKVLQLKNQPEDEVYNGDIGEIMEIMTEEDSVTGKHQILVDFDGVLVAYSGEQISHITHAYCISIHKAQGSEYPIVIMPMVKEYSFMLSKRLIYTGITRAKKSLLLLGSQDVFQKSIRRQDRHIRKSMLEQRVRQSFE